MFRPFSQHQHDHMVTLAARHLVAKGFRDVRADLAGWSRPQLITWTRTGRGHRPDLTAEGSELNLFEAETTDSIFDQHTRDQWMLFATFARESSGKFWVIVPRGSGVAASRRLDELSVGARVWEL